MRRGRGASMANVPLGLALFTSINSGKKVVLINFCTLRVRAIISSRDVNAGKGDCTGSRLDEWAV